MSGVKRTRAAAAKIRVIAQPQPDEDDLFEAAYQQAHHSDQDSDHSEYGKKAKGKAKRRKMATFKPGPAPKLPELSDDEYDDHRAASLELGEVPTVRSTQRQTTSSEYNANGTPNREGASDKIPKVLQIHLPTPKKGLTTINLDLAGIIFRSSSEAVVNSPAHSRRIIDDNEDTLVEEPSKISNKTAEQAKGRASSKFMQKTGFLNLPFEIRIRVYRQVFVTEEPIVFHLRENFCRSSGFLRTCQIVHDEGRAILYGENAFHFERISERRGQFFEKIWKEVGFKDARRFFDLIGPGNISCLKYVSFTLSDAMPSFTPYLEEEERRFANDSVLHYILNLVGSYATLSKLAFTFGGRRGISITDFHFLKAITSMRCHELIHVPAHDHRHQPKVTHDVLQRMKKIMVVARDDEDEVDEKKRKRPTVRMQHEKPSSSRYSSWV